MSATRKPVPAVGPSPDPEPSGLSFHDVTSADGTRLRAWSNAPVVADDAPVVLLCNGLGTNPYTWPALLRRDCGVRVVSWYHRGTGGSERPRHRRDVGIDTFVADALAVMDDAGLDRVPVLGWSMGVNTAFELAVTHPDRVAGLFAVAGVPGSTFASMLGPLHLPRPVAQALTVGAARVLKYGGPAITPVAQRLRMGRLGVTVLTHSGFMLPTPDPEGTGRAVRDFLTTPIDWYGHVALATSKHRRVPLGTIRVPTTFVAGRYDVLAGARDMASAAARIPGATYVELPASHFVQMEHPEEVHALLLDFLATVEE